jgi:hypothetical protein
MTCKEIHYTQKDQPSSIVLRDYWPERSWCYLARLMAPYVERHARAVQKDSDFYLARKHQ